MTAQIATSSLSSPSPTQSTSSSGLNNAGRIGIGVGVSSGVLFFTIIAFLAYMLRRRTRSLREKGTNKVPTGYDMTGDPTQVLEQNRLMPGVHELHGIPHSRELEGSGIQYSEELEGSVAPCRGELA